MPNGKMKEICEDIRSIERQILTIERQMRLAGESERRLLRAKWNRLQATLDYKKNQAGQLG